MMKTPIPTLSCLCVLVGIAASASAQSVTYDFEPPAYVPGWIQGQQGWSMPGNPEVIDNTFARSSAQSLHIQTISGATASHFNTNLSSNLGWGLTYDIFVSSNGTNATSCCAVSLGTAVGRTWYLGIYGNGNVDVFGAPVVHDALGAGALNQWLHVEVSGYNPTGDVNVLITGTGINRFVHAQMPVQGVRQDYVTVDMNNDFFNSDTGGNWWVDNLTVSFVPTPGAGAVLALGGMMLTRRRR